MTGIPFWGTTFQCECLAHSHYAIIVGETKIGSGPGRLVEMEIVEGHPLIMVRSIIEPSGVCYSERISLGIAHRNSHPDGLADSSTHSLIDEDTPRIFTQYLYRGEVVTFERWLELSKQAQSAKDLREGRKISIPQAEDIQVKASLVYPLWKGCIFPMRRVHLFHSIHGKGVLPGHYYYVLRMQMHGHKIVSHVMEDRHTFAHVTYAQC